MATIPSDLDVKLQLTLHNFSLARSVVHAMALAGVSGPDKPAPTTLSCQFPNGDSFSIKGENCGFALTPIVHAAALDVRRCQDFFRIGIDKDTLALKVLPPLPADSDDYSIHSLGLNSPTVADLDALAQKHFGRNAEAPLVVIRTYSNKTIAHYTSSSPDLPLQDIAEGIFLMGAAILELIYDQMNLPRPYVPGGIF